MLKAGLTLYFVRHGETDWNAVRRYQGQTDTPLNDRGREQAARNGRELARILNGRAAAFDFVASPLARTAETMRIIRREMGLDPDAFARNDLLKEINFGHWEGQIWDELPNTDPEEFAARKADPYRWRPRNGESYEDLARRVGNWLTSLERDTVVVSHGGVSRVVRGHVLGLDWGQIHTLDVPQDRILQLRRGEQEWL
ncbi:MAG: histidine phosphatase family protein [Hyphomicrobiaceae bacterium]